MKLFIQGKRSHEDRFSLDRSGWNENNMEGILSLRNLVFGEVERDKLDPRFFKWQIRENPDGTAWIYLVEDGNKIVGHLADLPKRFSVQGKSFSEH